MNIILEAHRTGSWHEFTSGCFIENLYDRVTETQTGSAYTELHGARKQISIGRNADHGNPPASGWEHFRRIGAQNLKCLLLSGRRTVSIVKLQQARVETSLKATVERSVRPVSLVLSGWQRAATLVALANAPRNPNTCILGYSGYGMVTEINFED